jgi:uncharacterized protein YecT (DUF1311 family)
MVCGMKYVLRRALTGFVLAAAFQSLFAAPLWAGGRDPFAYKMVMTPEEGPLDPVVEQRYSRQFATCQAHAAITSHNAACFEAEFVRQDIALNRAWRTALGRLPDAKHGPFLVAQRHWIAARDPFCRQAAGTEGTIVPVVYSNCRVEQTIRRTIWLERLR